MVVLDPFSYVHNASFTQAPSAVKGRYPAAYPRGQDNMQVGLSHYTVYVQIFCVNFGG